MTVCLIYKTKNVTEMAKGIHLLKFLMKIGLLYILVGRSIYRVVRFMKMNRRPHQLAVDTIDESGDR